MTAMPPSPGAPSSSPAPAGALGAGGGPAGNTPGAATPLPPLGEEARLLLAESAARQERANQPRAWLLAGLGLAALSMVWVLLASRQREAARELLSNEVALTAEMQSVVADILRLKEEEQGLGGRGSIEPDPLMVKKIEDLAASSGLRGVSISESNDQRSGGPPGLRRKNYSSKNFTAQEAPALFTWLLEVPRQLPGVELSLVDLSPAIATVDGVPRWTGTVTFARWERVGAP